MTRLLARDGLHGGCPAARAGVNRRWEPGAPASGAQEPGAQEPETQEPEARGSGAREPGAWERRATDLAPAGVDLALQLVTQPPHLVEDLPERGWVQGTDCPSRCVELCEQIAAQLGDANTRRRHDGRGCRRRCRHRWWRDGRWIGLGR